MPCIICKSLDHSFCDVCRSGPVAANAFPGMMHYVPRMRGCNLKMDGRFDCFWCEEKIRPLRSVDLAKILTLRLFPCGLLGISSCIGCCSLLQRRYRTRLSRSNRQEQEVAHVERSILSEKECLVGKNPWLLSHVQECCNVRGGGNPQQMWHLISWGWSFIHRFASDEPAYASRTTDDAALENVASLSC